MQRLLKQWWFWVCLAIPAGPIGVAIYLESLVHHTVPYWVRARWAIEDLIKKVWH
jgi:hypothetical protein